MRQPIIQYASRSVLLLLHGGSHRKRIRQAYRNRRSAKEINKTLKKIEKLPTGACSPITVFKNRI